MQSNVKSRCRDWTSRQGMMCSLMTYGSWKSSLLGSRNTRAHVGVRNDLRDMQSSQQILRRSWTTRWGTRYSLLTCCREKNSLPGSRSTRGRFGVTCGLRGKLSRRKNLWRDWTSPPGMRCTLSDRSLAGTCLPSSWCSCCFSQMFRRRMHGTSTGLPHCTGRGDTLCSCLCHRRSTGPQRSSCIDLAL